MTLGIGYDSAYPPTLAQAQLAKLRAGPVSTWWGFYIPNVPNTDPLNTWTPPQMGVLKNAGFQPVPIVVPKPPHPADPVVTATSAVGVARAFGLNPKVSICYNGEHINVSGPVWLPIPGAKPTAVGPGSAIQWGQDNVDGLSVDLSVSAEDWPGSSGIVIDLEHSAAYDSAWYATVQQHVAALTAPVKPTPIPTPIPPKDPPVTANPMPNTVKAVNSSIAAGRLPGWLDVLITGSDGNVYHYWWDTHAWNGYDIINKY